MGVSFTKEQQLAIDTRNSNILVQAAAGSGKTAVLIQRLIKIITNKEKSVDIDKLVVLTFTKAAASEMKERLVKELLNRLNTEHENKSFFQRQLLLINNASITTLHSFCLDLIKKNFHLLDIDANFRIADQIEINLLKVDVIENLFEEFYQKEDSHLFFDLIESYSTNKEDTKLKEIILEIYDFMQSNLFRENWICDSIEKLNIDDGIDFEKNEWLQIINQEIIRELQQLIQKADYAIKLCNKSYGPIEYEKTIKDDKHMIQNLQIAINKGIENFYNELYESEFSKLARANKDTEESLKEKVKDIRDEIKESIKNIREKIFFQSPENMKQNLKQMYDMFKILGEIVLLFSTKFKEEKRKRRIIDFNDIEHFALSLLLDMNNKDNKVIPSKLALQLQSQYEEILIDEYQDINSIQEAILTAISKDDEKIGNRFMVGDIKQSIYKFRLANPDIFIEKYNDFLDEDNAKNRKIDLAKNFRSREEILYFINFIFNNLMTDEVGDIKYDDKVALYKGFEFPSECKSGSCNGEIELNIINQTKQGQIESDEETDEEQTDENENMDNITLEANVVAQKIKSIIEDKEFCIYDKEINDYRNVEYRDIIILLRTTSRWANIFKEVLLKQNINAHTENGEGYFDTIEIKTIVSLLQIIDNPLQDIPFVAILKSPIVGLTANELAEIRNYYPEDYFYDAVRKVTSSQIQFTELNERLNLFLDNLSKWREMSSYTYLNQLIWNIYVDTNYYNYVSCMLGGKQRQANLRLFLDRAHQYEQTSYKGLFNFIRFIKKLKENKGDMGQAKVLSENENVVRIMSIHKSKGLEFPIVFVCGLGKKFNLQDLRKPILIHQKLGFGPNYVDCKRRISSNTLAKIAISKKIHIETLAEEMRILYVALTRAKEKLYLFGTIKNVENQIQKYGRYINYEKPLTYTEITKSQSYLEWICKILLKHKDGHILRSYLDDIDENKIIQDSATFNINIYDNNIINSYGVELKTEKEKTYKMFLDYSKNMISEEMKQEYENIQKEIDKRLNFSYSYKTFASLPAKVSVSEIKNMYLKMQNDTYQDFNLDIQETLFKKPQFITAKQGYNSLEKGILIHFIMKEINISAINQQQDIIKQLEYLRMQNKITEEELKLIPIEWIYSFANSKLADRIKISKNIKKEYPFIVSLNIKDIYEDIDQNGEILVQGVIDCFFEEEDGFVLVDYKTDYVTKENIQEIAEKYRKQVDLYEKALQQITGKKIKQKILYFLQLDGEIIL